LRATVRANLAQARAQQLPLFAVIVPFLGAGSEAYFQSGTLEGRLAGGVFRVARLELTGNNLDVFAQGVVTLAERLGLGGTLPPLPRPPPRTPARVRPPPANANPPPDAPAVQPRHPSSRHRHHRQPAGPRQAAPPAHRRGRPLLHQPPAAAPRGRAVRARRAV